MFRRTSIVLTINRFNMFSSFICHVVTVFCSIIDYNYIRIKGLHASARWLRHRTLARETMVRILTESTVAANSI